MLKGWNNFCFEKTEQQNKNAICGGILSLSFHGGYNYINTLIIIPKEIDKMPKK